VRQWVAWDSCQDDPTGLRPEIQTHPHWQNVPQIFQQRILKLADDAPDAGRGILIAAGTSVRELMHRYGWSYGQALRTLEALRKHGIAYSRAHYEPCLHGGRRQVGSEYVMVRDGRYRPQAKRVMTAARRRGAKRAARTRAGGR
jgi:hypothetical protein